jgi:hypothetical protein
VALPWVVVVASDKQFEEAFTQICLLVFIITFHIVIFFFYIIWMEESWTRQWSKQVQIFIESCRNSFSFQQSSAHFVGIVTKPKVVFFMSAFRVFLPRHKRKSAEKEQQNMLIRKNKKDLQLADISKYRLVQSYRGCSHRDVVMRKITVPLTRPIPNLKAMEYC